MLDSYNHLNKNNKNTCNSYEIDMFFDSLIKSNLHYILDCLNRGFDPNIKNKESNTPVKVALNINNLQLVDLLLRYNANPNVLNSDGLNILQYACIEKNIEAVNLILRYNPDPYVESTSGLNSLDYANNSKNKEIYNILENYIKKDAYAGDSIVNNNKSLANNSFNNSYCKLNKNTTESLKATSNKLNNNFKRYKYNDNIYNNNNKFNISSSNNCFNPTRKYTQNLTNINHLFNNYDIKNAYNENNIKKNLHTTKSLTHVKLNNIDKNIYSNKNNNFKFLRYHNDYNVGLNDLEYTDINNINYDKNSNSHINNNYIDKNNSIMLSNNCSNVKLKNNNINKNCLDNNHLELLYENKFVSSQDLKYNLDKSIDNYNNISNNTEINKKLNKHRIQSDNLTTNSKYMNNIRKSKTNNSNLIEKMNIFEEKLSKLREELSINNINAINKDIANNFAKSNKIKNLEVAQDKYGSSINLINRSAIINSNNFYKQSDLYRSNKNYYNSNIKNSYNMYDFKYKNNNDNFRFKDYLSPKVNNTNSFKINTDLYTKNKLSNSINNNHNNQHIYNVNTKIHKHSNYKSIESKESVSDINEINSNTIDENCNNLTSKFGNIKDTKDIININIYPTLGSKLNSIENTAIPNVNNNNNNNKFFQENNSSNTNDILENKKCDLTYENNIKIQNIVGNFNNGFQNRSKSFICPSLSNINNKLNNTSSNILINNIKTDLFSNNDIKCNNNYIYNNYYNKINTQSLKIDCESKYRSISSNNLNNASTIVKSRNSNNTLNISYKNKPNVNSIKDVTCMVSDSIEKNIISQSNIIKTNNKITKRSNTTKNIELTNNKIIKDTFESNNCNYSKKIKISLKKISNNNINNQPINTTILNNNKIKDNAITNNYNLPFSKDIYNNQCKNIQFSQSFRNANLEYKDNSNKDINTNYYSNKINNDDNNKCYLVSPLSYNNHNNSVLKSISKSKNDNINYNIDIKNKVDSYETLSFNNANIDPVIVFSSVSNEIKINKNEALYLSNKKYLRETLYNDNAYYSFYSNIENHLNTSTNNIALNTTSNYKTNKNSDNINLYKINSRSSLKSMNIIKNNAIKQSLVSGFKINENNKMNTSQNSVINQSNDIDYNSIVYKLNNSNNNYLSINNSNTNKENNSLYIFLESLGMIKYYNIFVQNGFDDLDIMKDQTKLESNPISHDVLSKLGIKKPGDRSRFILKLEEISDNFNFVVPIQAYFKSKEEFTLNNSKSENKNIHNLHNWLSLLKMESYLKCILDNGFYNIELLLLQSLTKSPLDDYILENEFKINKLGYRARLLNRIKLGKFFIICLI